MQLSVRIRVNLSEIIRKEINQNFDGLFWGTPVMGFGAESPIVRFFKFIGAQQTSVGNLTLIIVN